jgi:hypothetical protein
MKGGKMGNKKREAEAQADCGSRKGSEEAGSRKKESRKAGKRESGKAGKRESGKTGKRKNREKMASPYLDHRNRLGDAPYPLSRFGKSAPGLAFRHISKFLKRIFFFTKKIFFFVSKGGDKWSREREGKARGGRTRRDRGQRGAGGEKGGGRASPPGMWKKFN